MNYIDLENLNKVKQVALARIHAHISGDGDLYTYLHKRSPSSVRTSRSTRPFRVFIIEYTNNEAKLITEFENDIKTLFGNQIYIYKGRNRCQVSRRPLYLLLRELGAGKSREWSVPKIIYNSFSLSKEWLRAFFDDEATVENSKDRHKRIRVKSVNEDGLEQVRKMISKLGINANITGPNCDKTWYLTVKDFEKYNNLIGFNHTIKSNKLQNMVEMRQRGISG